MASLLTKPAIYGALSPLYLGCFPETEGKGGRYLVPWGRDIPAFMADRLQGDKWEQPAEDLNSWVEEQVRKWKGVP